MDGEVGADYNSCSQWSLGDLKPNNVGMDGFEEKSFETSSPI